MNGLVIVVVGVEVVLRFVEGDDEFFVGVLLVIGININRRVVECSFRR